MAAGSPPLGYLNEPKERTIVPDPERFPLVQRMWQLLLQGVSPLESIAGPPRNGGYALGVLAVQVAVQYAAADSMPFR